jgi:hypothetical protein
MGHSPKQWLVLMSRYTEEVWVPFKIMRYGICRGKTGTATDFPRVLQFSPARIIPPIPCINSLIYHLRYIGLSIAIDRSLKNTHSCLNVRNVG